MAEVQRTLSIVKPDAVEAGASGDILSRFERAGLRIIALKKLQMTRQQTEGFYAVHRERPFFASLTKFMSSGPIVVCALEGDNAIARYRELMGATDPAEAAEGTLRKRFATNIERNACHGSDAPETARTELAYFFSALDYV